MKFWQMGQSLEAFLQWKALVSLILGCTEAVSKDMFGFFLFSASNKFISSPAVACDLTCSFPRFSPSPPLYLVHRCLFYKLYLL